MNVDDYLKSGLDNFIDDFADDAIKLFPKNNIKKSEKKVTINEKKNETEIINNRSQIVTEPEIISEGTTNYLPIIVGGVVNECEESDDEEIYEEDGNEFYSKEEIYGCVSDDEDSVECEDYKELHTYMKNEKHIIPEINEDYKEDEENFKYQVDEEYEKFHKHEMDKENDKLTEKETDPDDPANIILNEVKAQKEKEKEKEMNEKNETFVKHNKIKIANGLGKLMSNKYFNKKEGQEDHGPYIFSIINLFMKYFNTKYRTNLNFFSGIEDTDKDTNKQMELFVAVLDEYEYIKEKIFLGKKDEFYFEDIRLVKEHIDNSNIESVFIMEINLEENKKTTIYSPSLLDCFNYLHINSDINKTDGWNIYNLK